MIKAAPKNGIWHTALHNYARRSVLHAPLGKRLHPACVTPKLVASLAALSTSHLHYLSETGTHSMCSLRRPVHILSPLHQDSTCPTHVSARVAPANPTQTCGPGLPDLPVGATTSSTGLRDILSLRSDVIDSFYSFA